MARKYIQQLITELETIRLQHGNLEVLVSDGVRIEPVTSVSTPLDENGVRSVIIEGTIS